MSVIHTRSFKLMALFLPLPQKRLDNSVMETCGSRLKAVQNNIIRYIQLKINSPGIKFAWCYRRILVRMYWHRHREAVVQWFLFGRIL